MGMSCNQCQESIHGTGCNVRGVCGKDEPTAQLQDVLAYAAEGLALAAEKLEGSVSRKVGQLISESLFVTVTNTSFDEDAIVAQIRKTLAMRDELNATLVHQPHHDAAHWTGSTEEDFLSKAGSVSIESLSENDRLAF